MQEQRWVEGATSKELMSGEESKHSHVEALLATTRFEPGSARLWVTREYTVKVSQRVDHCIWSQAA